MPWLSFEADPFCACSDKNLSTSTDLSVHLVDLERYRPMA